MPPRARRWRWPARSTSTSASCGAALDDPGAAAAGAEAFLLAFVRPHGLDRPATPIVADAIEAAARDRRLPFRLRP